MDYLANINWNRLTPCLVLLVLEVLLEFSECTTPAEVNKHLELGRDFLARGQLSDALTHYHAAVEGDPNNYLTYFKRGTVYYALGKARFALQDFTKVLELKPDFTSARMQRATVYLKLAQYEDAKEDYLQVTRAEPHNAEALEALGRVDEYAEEYRLCAAYYRGGEHRAAADVASRLLDVSPWAAALRQLRADCHIALDDLFSAVSDIRSVNRLLQDSTAGYLRLGTLLYQLGHVTDALKEIRECLKLDPEHKECFPLYKKLKKVDKYLSKCEERSEAHDYEGCIEAAQQVLEAESEVTLVVFEARKWLCSCSVKDGHEAGDREGVPQGGAEVAPGQLPRRRQEARRETVHRYRRCQRGPDGPRQARPVRPRRGPARPRGAARGGRGALPKPLPPLPARQPLPVQVPLQLERPSRPPRRGAGGGEGDALKSCAWVPAHGGVVLAVCCSGTSRLYRI